jgi:site-specific recombinase XerD
VRLKDKFAGWDYRDLTDEVITEYKAWVLGKPVDELTTPLRRSWAPIEVPLTKSTINRDLAVLSKAYRDNKMARMHAPAWKKYPEKELNTRKGRVSLEEFASIMALALPLWWRTYLQILFDTGNRSGEFKKLRVWQFETLMVDGELCGGFQLDRGHNREAATEKNGKGRWVPLSRAGMELVQQLVAGKGPDELVFTREDGRGMGDHRDLWKNTVQEAGIERKILLHDFRRTATTDFRAAKVDMKASMEAIGHSGEHIHLRYQITDKENQIAAMRQKEAYVEAKRGGITPEGNSGGNSGVNPLDEMRRELESARAQNAQLLGMMEGLKAAIAAMGPAQPVQVFTKPVANEVLQ